MTLVRCTPSGPGGGWSAALHWTAVDFRNRVWPKLLAKAGLRTIRIHDLRHTYARLLIAQGESVAYVRDQMGHHTLGANPG